MQIKSDHNYRVTAINQSFDHQNGEYSDKKIVLTLEAEDGTMASIIVDNSHHPQIGDTYELSLVPSTVVQKSS